jgi:hypothetical protein
MLRWFDQRLLQDCVRVSGYAELVAFVPLLHAAKVRVDKTINHAVIQEALSFVDRDVAI